MVEVKPVAPASGSDDPSARSNGKCFYHFRLTTPALHLIYTTVPNSTSRGVISPGGFNVAKLVRPFHNVPMDSDTVNPRHPAATFQAASIWPRSYVAPAFLSINADPATLFFGIPPEQVVELGTQVDL